MKFTWMIAVVCMLFLAILPMSPALGQNQTTWVGGSGATGDNWFAQANWDGEVPDSSYEVIIPAVLDPVTNKFPVIPNTTVAAEARKLTIHRDANGAGKLTINGNEDSQGLVLGNGSAQTSTLDGILNVGAAGTGLNAPLRIRGDHTIEGAGGEIVLHKDAVIEEYTCCGSDRLTIKRSGSTPCADYPDGLPCSVLLHGEGRIRVKLNNQAFVVSDDLGLGLQHRRKTGTSEGWWVVENSATLNINCQVVDACHWYVVDTSDVTRGPLVYLANGGNVASSGPVTFKHGQFIIKDGNFCTTGNLLWKSIGPASAPTHPFFSIGEGQSASFGVSLCPIDPEDCDPEDPNICPQS